MNKNLKKVISSVAALTMVASSVAAFAVDFPDVESTASYAQAVQELSALDVISGYDDGTFGPDKLVTRAEITKMIVDALAERSSAEASTESTKFADVSADHWAKGYINQGVADGFIAGMSDTEFDPDANVTYVQAQKMLVSAIGYETYAAAQGGWPTGYKTYAASLDITKGISGITDSTELTRAQVAQMIDNAMDAPLCVIASWKTEWNGTRTPNLETRDGKEGRAYETLFTEKHDAYKVYGRVTDTSKTGSSSIDVDKVEFQVEKADNFDDEEVKSDSPVSEEMYIGDSKADNYLRTYSQALIQKNDDDEFTILSITPAAANKSTTLASEDFDEIKSDADAKTLYFFPAGTTKGSTKYQLADTFTVYVNGVEDSTMTADKLISYLDANETASVTLQKETETGSTSASSKYNVVMISSYATAVVDEVIDKTNETTINFDEYSTVPGNTSKSIGSKLKVEKDNEDKTYSFILDGKQIEATELQENDVLNIAYDMTQDLNGSNFVDVIVTRNVVEGAKCTSVNTNKGEYTVGGTKYKIAEGMTPDLQTSTEYSLYLDHFGRIAKTDENSVSKNYGVLKNIYKKASGEYIAQIITKNGSEEEYKVDDKNMEKLGDSTNTDKSKNYSLYLLNPSSDGSADYKTTSKKDSYPKQVVEYSISSSSNKITIKNALSDVSATAEYKESGNKIGSVKISDAAVILDLSEVNDKDTYTVVPADNLKNDNTYTAYGYDKSNSDSTYRFVILTDGTTSVFDSNTQLAVFNGSEVVDDDGDKTAYNLIVNGEEKQYILDDDVANNGFEEGDPLVFATNSEGEISKIYPLFKTQNLLNEVGGTVGFDAFKAKAYAGEVLSADIAKINNELSKNSDDDVTFVFGPVVNKTGNNITIGKIKGFGGKTHTVNYDEKDATEVNYKDAKIYTYDFSASSKNSKVLLDEGIAVTPDSKAAKLPTTNGDDILDLDHDDVKDDVVFALVRTIDDEAQEIYLIVNND